MALNYIWLAFFLIAFVVSIVLALLGDTKIFERLILALSDASKTGFEVSLGLVGAMSFWLGIMRVGERAGLIHTLARWVEPFFGRLFPGVPTGHPAHGSMMMSFAANMLGLDNAATPLGLQAMKELQQLNISKPDTASDAQIMFMVLHAAGFTLVPVSILVYRTQMGAAMPSDVFLPILMATYCATLTGLVSVAIRQKIRLLDPVLLISLLCLTALVAGLASLLAYLGKSQIGNLSSIIGNFILLLIICGFLLAGMRKKLNVFETFIEGAKEGFETSIKIIPYLVAILVAISVFRACGAMDFLLRGIGYLVAALGLDTGFVPALPTMFMKPLSGSGARGLMLETMKIHGPDSFVGRLVCIIQGSADTTFFILAVYFGSVQIKNTRYALMYGLIADAAGFLAAIALGYMFFG